MRSVPVEGKRELTMDECKALLGLSASRIQQLLASGKLIPVYRKEPGKRMVTRYISYDSVRRYVKENQIRR